jgi:uncharacterized protein (DUF1800 family)
MPQTDIPLLAHLMRRAGFGATRRELEGLASREYEDVVEDLLHPVRSPALDEDLFMRYYMHAGASIAMARGRWLWRMINTPRPLEEKMTLFWHHVFATAEGKSEHPPSSIAQIETFRRVCLTDMRTILVELSKDPAMIFWLDNNENHMEEPNENYGRELLELFSLGVGNYAEDDIKSAARAFTGWTFTQPIPLYPSGQYDSVFEYRPDDHDDGEKTFLGQTGRFNGEDIIGIVVKQPATGRFLSRHLYNFFVADEPQVPAWETVAPQDQPAIDTLSDAYFDSDGDMRSVLRLLFNSDFFKEARFRRVKSPAELVVGTIRLVGTHRAPEPGIMDLDGAASAMGQMLMNPPTVEGWHTGREWIDGGTLNERVNFAADQVADVSKPGIQEIVARLGDGGGPLSPEELVARCLDLVGPIDASDETRKGLLRLARSQGDLRFDTDAHRKRAARSISRMLQLIVSSREYQFA